MTWLIPAFLFGLLSSWHCGIMCGPLVTAVNHNQPVSMQLLYHSGRLASYLLLGLILGGLSLFAGSLQWQKNVSLIIGALLLFSVFNFAIWERYFSKLIFYRKLISGIRSRLKKKRTIPSQAAIGFLNGLLPCGLVYTMILVAAGMNDVKMGALVMLFFGLGTLPVLFLLPATIGLWQRKYSNGLKWATSIMLATISITFIWKGLHAEASLVNPLADLSQVGKWISSCF